MVIHFESFGNFTTGIASYRALISKKSRGTLKLTDKAFSFKSEKDKILFDIKISDIQNFYINKRFNLTTIRLLTKQGLQFNFYPHKKEDKSLSTSKKLTEELFIQLARLTYKTDQPILFEINAGLSYGNKGVSDLDLDLKIGILLLTEDFLSFKAYNEEPVEQISIKNLKEISYNELDKNSPIQISSSDNKILNIFATKKNIGRVTKDKTKTRKLFELVNQAKIYKASEQIRLEKEEQERLHRIKSMFEVSNKIRLDMVRTVLGMEEKMFNDKIFQWARQFKFIIDGDYLIINSDTISEFLENLKIGFDLSIRRGLRKKCINCGENIDFSAKICTFCGKEQDN
jgi:hypothetical protein